MDETFTGLIRADGRDWLGIPTGIAGGGMALTRLTALRGLPGWVVGAGGAGEVQEWKLGGFLEQGGLIYLYGPWLPGISLAETLGRPLEQVLPLLERLARALLALKARAIPLFDLQTDAIYFLDNGAVLFLPPEVMRRVADSRPQEYQARVYHEINHNGLRGERRISFSLGALLYRAATGAFPFHGESEEEIQDRMRRLNILPPALAAPGIRPELSDLVLRALGRAGSPPGLEEWLEALADWNRSGAFRPLSDRERQTLSLEAGQKREKNQREFRRRLYWRHHWKAIALIAVVALAVGGLAASLLRRYLEPRSTRGYSPEQVVETFYLSWNRLDHQTMSDCLARGVGRDELNEVMHLYVLSRVSLGYEGRSSIVAADEWLARGRPDLEGRQSVYGITGLDIRPLPAGETPATGAPGREPVFEATYVKWLPAPAEEAGDAEAGAAAADASSGLPPAAAYRVRDRLALGRHRGDWVIVRLERLESSPVPAAEAVER